MKMIILAAALMIAGPAMAATCRMSDMPVVCFESASENGAYCKFPDGGVVRQSCWKDRDMCSHSCVAQWRHALFKKKFDHSLDPSEEQMNCLAAGHKAPECEKYFK